MASRAVVGTLLAAASLALAVSLPAAAGAASHRTGLRLSPSKPISSKSIAVKWRAPTARTRGRTYRIELRIKASGLCTSVREYPIRRSWNRRDVLNIRFRPNDRTLGRASNWCPGTATMRVLSTRPRSRKVTHAVLRFRIREDAANPVPRGIDVESELLEGSSLTVRVPGRPDRSGPLTGLLSGRVPGKLGSSSDIEFELTSGALSLESLEADPLCPPSDRGHPLLLSLASSGTRATLRGARFEMSLALAEDPSAVTSCAGASSPGPAWAMKLSGRSSSGLERIEASGTFEGARLADGASVSITLNLVLGVDLSAL